MLLRKAMVVALVVSALVGILLYLFLRQQARPQVRHPSHSIVFERTRPSQIVGELFPLPPTVTPPPPSDENAEKIMEELAKDEEELLSLIEKTKQGIAEEIQNLGKSAVPPLSGELPQGGRVVRELDLSGHPESTVQTVMARYGMRMERRYVSQFTPNTFISRARVSGSRLYYSSGEAQPGIYDVFELTPRAVAKMSVLEEEELRKRGFDPTRCLTSRVVFGIIRTPSGEYDLGVVELEAKPLP